MTIKSRTNRWLLAGTLAAAVAATSTYAVAQNTTLRIGTSSSGSIFYTLAVGLSSMLTKHAMIGATAEPVGGSSANMFALDTNRIDLAIANSGAAYDAREGAKPFKGKIDVTLIAQGQQSLRQIIVRTGSGIEKPEDLVGKTIIGRRPALPEVGLVTDAFLKAYGIDPDKVRIVSTTNTGEAVNALKSNTVDAVVIPASRGASYLQSLAEDGRITFLDIPDDKAMQIRKLLPPYMTLMKLPAKTYPGQDKAVNVFSLSTYLVAAGRVPDDTIYTVTKTLFDNLKEFHSFHGTAREWTIEQSLDGPTVPFHPGAVRYFKEKGVWTPALEKQQAELSN